MANTFNPTGLNPVRYLNGAPWNNQLQTYRIRSGYANNIFRGDPVIIGAPTGGTSGYILSLADFGGIATSAGYTAFRGQTEGNDTVQNTPIFGVFMGCSYTNPLGVNPIDPASPGRQYWPAGTQTLGNVDAIANVIVDPNVVYSIQGDNVTQTFSYNVLQYAGITFPGFGATPTNSLVTGSTQTGQSSAFVDMSTLSEVPVVGSATTALNLRLLNLALGTTAPGNQEGAVANIWEVIIQNHYFVARSPA